MNPKRSQKELSHDDNKNVMGKEQRRVSRITGCLSITLIVRNASEGSVAAGPVPGLLNDVSIYGAGLNVSQIYIDDYHLFHSSRDNPSHILYLEAALSEEKTLSIPVRPIWFDHVFSGESKSFKMGVEFMIGSEDEQITCLNKLLAIGRKERESWLNTLLVKWTDHTKKGGDLP
ncbi:MAG: hypothetical protein JRG68_01820 [Deltaproteobacteria bacterium]|nr:hypothetical protein [Deltaproteobacteria bacterium]